MKTSVLKRIGILGGTFDPVHLGHLTLAQAALEECNLDIVYFVPAGEPPHKRGQLISPAEHRQRMVELAIQGQPFFKLCNFEIMRRKPSYTVHLMHHMQHNFPGSELFFILGADSLLEVESWYQFEELFQLSKFIVVKRQKNTDAELLNKIAFFQSEFHASIQLIQAVRMDVSSSEVRSRTADGQSILSMIPETVQRYIRQHRLYQSDTKGNANEHQ
ncbi:nicotinate-nucleotide adenylyltransferase [Anoxynatronum sibiricum]|uniref:Probable nicotinate-nucleotide adenylyltransferase n=1 Tax=Anoxynatronum sibiricum TaxID=210623 RepID=A0ABU9VY15_9CLOT